MAEPDRSDSISHCDDSETLLSLFDSAVPSSSNSSNDFVSDEAAWDDADD
jgi:hypothetical protein